MHICFLGLKAYGGCMAWPIMFIHASYVRIFSFTVDAGFFFKSQVVSEVYGHRTGTKRTQYFKSKENILSGKYCFW